MEFNIGTRFTKTILNRQSEAAERPSGDPQDAVRDNALFEIVADLERIAEVENIPELYAIAARLTAGQPS